MEYLVKAQRNKMKIQCYQEIRIFPDCELGEREIGEVLFSLLHLEFVKNKGEDGNSQYAISFPEFSKGNMKTFGRVFRIFSYDEKILHLLDIPSICHRLDGYVESSEILKTPNASSYLRFFRVQNKTSIDRLARRMAQRKGISFEEAKNEYKNFKPIKIKESQFPFFFIRSLSTKQDFSLIINCIEESYENNLPFNLYGLSMGGNVPNF